MFSLRLSRSLIVAAALVLPSLASAQSGDITMELRTPNKDGDFTPTTALELQEYFNRVQCECESEFEVRFQLADGVEPGVLDNERVDIFFGSQCDDLERQPECLEFAEDGIPDYGELRTVVSRFFTVRELAALGADSCTDLGEGQQTIFALVDPEQDGTYESVSTTPVEYDLRAPVLPDNLEIRGGEEAIVVDFDRPESDDDLFQYQVLCAEVENPSDPIKKSPTALYDRVDDITGCASDFAIPMEGVTEATPAGLALADPKFICGDGASSASSVRVDGLDNGSQYHVVLLAIDRQRNAQGIYLGVAEPRPAVDFWELYKDSGGSAEGGCQSSSAATLPLALLVLTLLLGLRRRRASILALVIAVSASTATAQPYWDELEQPIENVDRAEYPAWNVGIKLGPYTADVDGEFSGAGPGPFERTFGAKDGLMSQLEVERFFAYPVGQLGLSLMLGYHAKSAKAFETVNGQLMRIPDGENTGFKLLPMALSAVYRFTMLDDEYHIPVVPYGKFGLAYYYWWMTGPNGDVSEAGGEKAKGGSLGWQGSVGIALRAERFDVEAAQSLRNEFGVEHAGFYAELNMAKVDGFGSDAKLSVGDATWFAGVNFEF